MSPTSFQTAPPRDINFLQNKMDGGGFEPPKQVAADLQSVPFGHSGNLPNKLFKILTLRTFATFDCSVSHASRNADFRKQVCSVDCFAIYKNIFDFPLTSKLVRSNQNYFYALLISHRKPADYKSAALPIEPYRPIHRSNYC